MTSNIRLSSAPSATQFPIGTATFVIHIPYVAVSGQSPVVINGSITISPVTPKELPFVMDVTMTLSDVQLAAREPDIQDLLPMDIS